MSSKFEAMPQASALVTRRLFAKRGVAALAGAAGMALAGNAAAQNYNDELSGRTQDTPAQQSAAEPANGQFIVDFALAYHGYPYAWGGNGPGGFDCSGFTQFVILNTVGIDIGHSSHGQPGYGRWVDAGDLQPGDLVFFANTWGPGVSHTALYIGDGQMIHAENEGTGVTIGWVWSDYYGAHYYGATRLWAED